MYSLGVSEAVGAGQEGPETVPQQNKLLQTQHPAPGLEMSDHLILHSCWVRGKRNSGAATETGDVECQQPPLRMEVVQVLVELEETGAKSVDHYEGVRPWNWLCWLNLECPDDCFFVDWDV